MDSYSEARLVLRRWENLGGHKMRGLSDVATFCRPIDLKAKPKREHVQREYLP